MKCIDNAHQWHRFWSMRFAILSAAFGAITATYATFPDDWLPAIPNWVKLVLAFGALGSAAASAVSRVIKQERLRTTK